LGRVFKFGARVGLVGPDHPLLFSIKTWKTGVFRVWNLIFGAESSSPGKQSPS